MCPMFHEHPRGLRLRRRSELHVLSRNDSPLAFGLGEAV